MFIVIEGVDCSGKSSVANAVAVRVGGHVYETPPQRFRGHFRPPEIQSDLRQHYAFYRDSNIVASEEISKLLSDWRCVVCVRYWFSTVAYHRVGELKVEQQDFKHLIQPDLVVLLWVSPEVQRARHRASRGDERNRIEGFQDKLNASLHYTIITSGLRFITINAERFGVESVAELVVSAMAQIDVK
jgi:thymidylate kinase